MFFCNFRSTLFAAILSFISINSLADYPQAFKLKGTMDVYIKNSLAESYSFETKVRFDKQTKKYVRYTGKTSLTFKDDFGDDVNKTYFSVAGFHTNSKSKAIEDFYFSPILHETSDELYFAAVNMPIVQVPLPGVSYEVSGGFYVHVYPICAPDDDFCDYEVRLGDAKGHVEFVDIIP